MSKVAKVLSKTVKGSQFVGVRGYQKQPTKNQVEGAINNYLIAVGYDHGKMKATELAELEATSAEALQAILPEQYAVSLKSHHSFTSGLVSADDITAAIPDAYNELVESRRKPASENKRSVAQTEAYEPLANGVLYCKETGNIMIRGLSLKSTPVKSPVWKEKTEQKPVKSSAKTLAKRAIEAHINKVNRGAFGHITQFILENGSFKMQKSLIE